MADRALPNPSAGGEGGSQQSVRPLCLVGPEGVVQFVHYGCYCHFHDGHYRGAEPSHFEVWIVANK